VIYTRQEMEIDERNIYTIDDLEEILSIVKDFEFIVQEKYRIAKDRPGSGNTKNIGFCVKIEELKNGIGLFTEYGIKIFDSSFRMNERLKKSLIFDDFWMHYMTKEMAKNGGLVEPPYNNLTTYLNYRNTKNL